MTEAEWMACNDPDPMLRLVRGSIGGRKIRLFAVACCRDIGSRLAYPEFHRAVEVAERAAEGHAGQEELQAAADATQAARFVSRIPLGDSSALKAAVEACGDMWMTVEAAASSAAYAFAGYACVYSPDSQSLHRAEVRAGKRAEQASLLRCLVPFPKWSLAVPPEWLTPTVRSLAAGINADRAFDRLPILADALQDAGCEVAELLNHCRCGGPHVRGCWAVDLILGKE